jgi:hypothetical protein
MQAWGTSLLIAVLVSTVPFTMFINVLLQLPRPLAQSHRRWPLPLNYALVAAVTSYTSYFIHRGYVGPRSTAEIVGGCVIAAVIYGFALTLLQRQFCGVYPEYIVTAGPAGFGLRKTSYRNIKDVETVAKRRNETEFRIETVHGRMLTLTLPTRYVSIFFEHIQKSLKMDGL